MTHRVNASVSTEAAFELAASACRNTLLAADQRGDRDGDGCYAQPTMDAYANCVRLLATQGSNATRAFLEEEVARMTAEVVVCNHRAREAAMQKMYWQRVFDAQADTVRTKIANHACRDASVARDCQGPARDCQVPAAESQT